MMYSCRVLLFISLILLSCGEPTPQKSSEQTVELAVIDTIAISKPIALDSLLDKKDSVSSAIAIDTQKVVSVTSAESVDVGAVDPEQVIQFAETLVGTPYVYGSTDPKVGFDCSGFITYVFNHFKINVPRSSVQFTNVGKTVSIEDAKRGDIILFTDPDFDNSTSVEVGHMGLITANNKGTISFIHSTSGKAMSVAVTPFNEHYQKRFVRVGRIFPQNN